MDILEEVKELLMFYMDEHYEDGSQLDETGERLLLCLISLTGELDQELIAFAISAHFNPLEIFGDISAPEITEEGDNIIRIDFPTNPTKH